MNKLEKKVSYRDTKLGKQLTTINVFRKDRKNLINPKDIKQMTTELHKKALKQTGDDFKIYIRTWAGDTPHTFNVDDSGDLIKFDEDDDYYDGVVKDEKKFLKYYKVDFYIEKY